MAKCKSCGAEIRWVKTENGKSMPLDEKPVPDGRITIKNGIAAIRPIPDTDGIRFNSHFVTCPNANQHRRKEE